MALSAASKFLTRALVQYRVAPARPGLALVTRHLLMLGTAPDMTLNPVMWNLVYELRISLLFRCSAVPPSDDLMPRYSHCRRCGFCPNPICWFAVGHHYVLAEWDILYDLGAALLIVLAVEGPRLCAFLNGPILQWLGRISYSTCLIHLPIMLVVVPVVIGHVHFGIVVAAVMVASLSAATLMHILVEAPAIELGHRLIRRTTASPRLAPKGSLLGHKSRPGRSVRG